MKRHKTQNNILETVRTQINLKDPPETKNTFERLLKEGFPEEEAIELICGAISIEIYRALQNKIPFNNDKYIRRLNSLPDLEID